MGIGVRYVREPPPLHLAQFLRRGGHEGVGGGDVGGGGGLLLLALVQVRGGVVGCAGGGGCGGSHFEAVLWGVCLRLSGVESKGAGRLLGRDESAGGRIDYDC
jgi:hypothetical protein